jgi:hypothetical protein
MREFSVLIIIDVIETLRTKEYNAQNIINEIISIYKNSDLVYDKDINLFILKNELLNEIEFNKANEEIIERPWFAKYCRKWIAFVDNGNEKMSFDLKKIYLELNENDEEFDFNSYLLS